MPNARPVTAPLALLAFQSSVAAWLAALPTNL